MYPTKLPQSLDLSPTGTAELAYVLYQRDYSTEALSFIANASRTLNYWGSEPSVLPQGLENTGPGKKRSYSFVDLIWLGIVSELRQMGMEKESIRTLMQEVLQVQDYSEIIASIREARFQTERELARHWQISITEVKGLLDQFMDRQEEIKNQNITPLLQYICYYFINKSPLHLLVNGKGHHYAFPQMDFALHVENPTFLEFFNRSHISISLSAIIQRFLGKPEVKDSIKQQFFSPKEWALIELIRKEQPQSISIKSQGGVKETIEVTSTVHVTLEHRLSEILTKGGYETITIKTQNGKPVYCRRTKQVKK